MLIILNDIKPYQPVKPLGATTNSITATSGIPVSPTNIANESVKDYSAWTYTLTSNYGLIREGENKITSKIVCQPGQGDPSFTSNPKHYSVNVTGSDSNTGSLSLPIQDFSTASNTSIIVIPLPNDLVSPSTQTNNLGDGGVNISNFNDNSEEDVVDDDRHAEREEEEHEDDDSEEEGEESEEGED